MPGNLYFYVNFWHILLNKDENAKTKSLARPWLRDVEWSFFSGWNRARGLSGFSNKPDMSDEELIHGLENGFGMDLGTPLYNHEAKDFMMLGCHGKGTKVSMYNGELKKVEDIVIGDILMGPDSKPRNVVKLFNGVDDLYLIKQGKGINYTINKNHILHFKRKRNNTSFNTTIDKLLSLKLNRDKTYNDIYGYKAKIIYYNKKKLLIDPYILGVWIGDGTSKNQYITGSDFEIIDYIKEKYSETYIKDNTAIMSRRPNYKINPGISLKRELFSIGVLDNKHIPLDYMTSDVGDRLELLAGLIDTDGCLDKKAYDFYQKDFVLCEQVKRLALSLGFYANISKSKNIFKVHITGNITSIPCKIKRKQSKVNGNNYNLSRISVEYIGTGEYFGFEVDGDNLFLLEDFTVNHNSRGFGKSFMVAGGVIGHEFLFDGAKKYYSPDDAEYDKLTTEIVVGAGDAKYSKLLLDKVQIGFNSLAGGMAIGDKNYPPPFYKQYSGSWVPNKDIIAQYEKRIGGTKQILGSKSTIKHRTFKDNPFAANGTRGSINVREEIGLFDNIIESQESTVDTMMDGTHKFGSALYCGCVCAGTKVWTNNGKLINIEDLKFESGILGHDENSVKKQNVNWINPPSKKQCYKIKFNDGCFIECSFDHPILVRSGRRDKFVKFIKASEIKKNNQVIRPGSIDIFGDKKYQDSYMIGLMIGDGYYPQNNSFYVSIDSKEVYEYVTSNYNTSIRKNWKTDSWMYYGLSIKVGRLQKLFRELKIIGQTKCRKRLPENIHEFDKESVAELIAGYFDADGNICKPSKRKNGRIVLTSNIFEILEQVKYQLIKFGIYSSIFKEKRNIPPSVGYENQQPYIYRLYITKNDDCVKFYENIPIKSKKKIDNLLMIINKPIKRKCGIINKTSFMFDDNFPKGEYFKNKFLSNLRTSTVISSECIGERDVYNINTSDTHTYIANAVITANTGGDMSRGTLGAYRMFYNPDTYSILTYDDVWENKGKIAYFVPAYYALNQYKKDGVTDTGSAIEFLQNHREKLRKKSGSTAALDSELQYRPLVPSEAFLRTSSNIFPVAELKDWLSNIETHNIYKDAEWHGDLIFDEKGNIRPVLNPNLRPIYDFPLERDKDSEGCIVIYHHPDVNDETGEILYGRYLAGIDPYDHDKSGTNSLGSCIIFDKFTNTIVAEYSGRPKFANTFFENTRRLLIYYNAIALYENEKQGVKQYFDKKNSLGLLMTQPEYIKDVIPNSTVDRQFGIHMPKALKDHGEILLRDWLQEEYEPGMLNLRKVRCIPLLKELIMYDGEINADRVMAFICVMYALQETYKHKLQYNKQKKTISNTFFDRKIFSRGNGR